MPTQPTDKMATELLHVQEELAAKNVDADAPKKQAQRASHRLNFLEAMMETVPVGVVMADAEGKIIYGNSHVEKMVRHPVLHSDDVDAYGEWVSYHADGSRVQSHEYPLARVIQNREDHVEIDVDYQRGDGTRFWMRIIGEPVLDGEGGADRRDRRPDRYRRRTPLARGAEHPDCRIEPPCEERI
ncbi:hypothetical protein Sulfitobl28_32550 (plasmid) [Sulfitobacter pontiacus]|nr:hypothetical protein Sulfitobl28_32550 [Sulfitobacter pontiacus]